MSDLVATDVQRKPLDDDAVAGLLYRRDVAMARHRSALGQSLGLSDVEVSAVLHLAHERELTTARLAALLDLSSGGATALVQRLERLGIAARRPHPVDRRSSLIRLTPKTASAIARAESVLRDGIREKLASMNDGARSAVAGFLTRLVELSEELTADRDSSARPQGGLVSRPVPSLWG